MAGPGLIQAASARLGVIRTRLDWSWLLWLAAVVALVMLVVVPLFWLGLASVSDENNGALTFANYWTAFSRRIYLEPVLNSLRLATAVGLIAVAVGTPRRLRQP